MKSELRRFGASRSPVLILDEFSGGARAKVLATAAALAPFPSARGTYYPGLRRIIAEADAAAFAYVEAMLREAAPYIVGAFEVDGFDLLEASFSMVTVPPESLGPPQRVPHFDSSDPRYLALLHYLSDTPGTGTAFYRQVSTGIEIVEPANVDSFLRNARRESADLEGYFDRSDRHFERIGLVEGLPDRLIVYPGRLLHSGVIPPGMRFSDDPARGRLTANIFILAHQERS